MILFLFILTIKNSEEKLRTILKFLYVLMKLKFFNYQTLRISQCYFLGGTRDLFPHFIAIRFFTDKSEENTQNSGLISSQDSVHQISPTKKEPKMQK